MKFGQAVKMAVKSILAKRGRSFLTMLGIIIGIASVMTIVSVVSGSNKQMMEYYESMGTNRITVYGYLYSGESMFEKIYDYAQGLGEDVVGVTTEAEYDGTVKYGAKTSDTMDWDQRPRTYFGSDQYALCNNFRIAKGRDVSRIDIENYNQICVLGAEAAKTFFDYANPIGQDLMIDGAPFRVVGVYEAKDTGFNYGYSLDNIIVLPYSTGRFLPNGNDSWGQCIIKVRDAQAINRVTSRVNDYINTITQDQTIGYGSAYSEQQWMESENEYTTMLSLVLGGIAGISLLVGGIGIMNIMLVTVTERTREIGIRRAIGAERGSIVTQFLVEAAMICGIGGIIGIGLGFLLTNILGKVFFDGMSLLPSTTITLGAFGFSVGLGIIFGMYPAIKASGLQPVVALRAE